MKLVTVAARAARPLRGARAGRERYEQIRELTHHARDNFDASAARRKLEAYGSRLDAYATRPSSRNTPPR
jgi:hypothetical protein